MKPSSDHTRYLQAQSLYEAVTQSLLEQGVDGFFMPKTDAHRSEYCADEENVMHFFTNFSGSMGACAYLASTGKGAVFVDGRYTLQASNEVDTERFHIINYTPKDITTWLSKACPPNARIGYDPALLSVSEHHLYKAHFKACGLDLIPLDHNPVTQAWTQQPKQTSYTLSAHDLQYAGVSFQDKLGVIQDQMKADNVDCTFLNYPESIFWLFNIRAHDKPFTPVCPLYAVIPVQGTCTLFCDETQKEALDALFGASVSLLPYEDTFSDHGLFTNKTVTLDKTNATVKMANLVHAQSGTIHEGKDYCDIPRACKNAVEIQGARDAHIRDGVAICHLLSWLENAITTETITELDVVNKLWAYRQEQDRIKGKSFDTISGAGPNGAIVHYRVTESTNRTLTPSDIFLLDSGGQYLDGTTDITRTISLNKKPSLEQKDRFTRVLKGHIALSTLKFPKNTTGSQIDAVARQYLWAIGANYDHGTGHGVGSYLGVHEGPQKISPALNTIPLLPGMIVSNEPGYYKTGEYGIRIENLEVVTKCDTAGCVDDREMYGFETVTLAPIDKSLIEKDLLSTDEIQWLNRYHKRVFETLSPLVQNHAKSWLKDATQPL